MTKMRDPKRIDRIICKLREVWLKEPDMRLGQLIAVIIGCHAPKDLLGLPDLFVVEDDITEELLDQLVDDSDKINWARLYTVG